MMIMLIILLLVSSGILHSLIHYIPAKLFYDKEIEAHDILAPVQKKLPTKPVFKVIVPFSGILRLFFRFKTNWQALVIDVILILYALLVYYYFGTEVWHAIMCYFFGVAMLGLAMIDFNHYVLPDVVTLPLLWLGLVLNLNGWIVPLKMAVIGAMIGYLALWILYYAFKIFTGKDGLGFGDFKLFAAIGAWFGAWSLPFVGLFAALVGIAFSMLMKLFGKEVKVMPFGVCLAVGWLIYYIFVHNKLFLA
ncbi:MAG: A24 family peptidase [Proteobacteria bacterium]|nr:A24 family peptidase [Pseudomonadota bacterium]